jgi:hypothetical protein
MYVLDLGEYNSLVNLTAIPVVYCWFHFPRYFCYIVAVSFIAGRWPSPINV